MRVTPRFVSSHSTHFTGPASPSVRPSASSPGDERGRLRWVRVRFDASARRRVPVAGSVVRLRGRHEGCDVRSVLDRRSLGDDLRPTLSAVRRAVDRAAPAGTCSATRRSLLREHGRVPRETDCVRGDPSVRTCSPPARTRDARPDRRHVPSVGRLPHVRRATTRHAPSGFRRRRRTGRRRSQRRGPRPPRRLRSDADGRRLRPTRSDAVLGFWVRYESGRVSLTMSRDRRRPPGRSRVGRDGRGVRPSDERPANTDTVFASSP